MKFKLASFLLLTTLFVMAGSRQTETEDIVFIVNADNPVAKMTVAEVRDYFFRRKRQWPDETSVRFIDRATGSNLRNIFLKNILKKSNSDVELFWIGQKLYSGDSAPLKESSDATTIQFVAAFKGAVGYVSSNTVINSKGVKTVQIQPAD